MPKVNAYLDDDCYALMKQLDLKPSELLQRAIRAEAEIEERSRELDLLIAERLDANGPPSDEDIAWAKEVLAPTRGASSKSVA